MYLGRVVGCVWSTVKNTALEGQRFLVVQPLTPELTPTGRRIVATDWTGAGAGETVYWVRSRESSLPFLPREVPTDATVVGIVDSVRVDRTKKNEGVKNEVASPEPALPAPPPEPAKRNGRRKS